MVVKAKRLLTKKPYFPGVALGIAFAYGWQLTLLTLAFVPFMVGAGVITMKVLTGQVGDIQNTSCPVPPNTF